jgi:hypothetical protein
MQVIARGAKSCKIYPVLTLLRSSGEAALSAAEQG